MARKRRKYTPEFKQEAVRLVTQEGMTFAQVVQDLGVNKSTIRDWRPIKRSIEC
jgi:transposase